MHASAYCTYLHLQALLSDTLTAELDQLQPTTRYANCTG